MKLTINIDCTPEEARAFFGQPDVTSINKIIVEELEKNTRDNLDKLADPAKFFEKAYASGGSMEQMQNMFAAMMAGTAGKK